MGCGQGFSLSMRSPFAVPLLLLVVLLLVDAGLGDRSSEEKRNKKLEAERAALASGIQQGKSPAQQREENGSGSANGSAHQDKQPDVDEFLNTIGALVYKRDQLQRESEELLSKIHQEESEETSLNSELGQLATDIDYMNARKKVCVRRIKKANDEMAGISTKYQELILWANQALTCLKGSCVEAENTFLNKKKSPTPGKLSEAVNQLMSAHNLNINAVEEGLTMPPQTGLAAGTTKAAKVPESMQGGFFTNDDILPVENDAMAASTTKGGSSADSFDSQEQDSAGTTPKGDEEIPSGTTLQVVNQQAPQETTGSKTNFCAQGTLVGQWDHGDENQILPEKNSGIDKRPEKLTAEKVLFEDGHDERYECRFDPVAGTKISFSMTVGNDTQPTLFEGEVLNDGKLIKWNDGDYWHKQNTD